VGGGCAVYEHEVFTSALYEPFSPQRDERVLTGSGGRDEYPYLTLSILHSTVFASNHARLRHYPCSGSNPLTSEIQVNGYTQDDQTLPSVASDAAGNVVIVWQSWGQDGDGWGVFANRYDSTGAALGDEFQVNQQTVYYQ
jgi:hypothetical protein